MPDIPTPPEVMGALNKADDIANGIGWPPFWRYPAPSQVDDVWKALGPVRDHIEDVGGQPLERPKNALPRELVAIARRGIFETELPIQTAFCLNNNTEVECVEGPPGQNRCDLCGKRNRPG